MSCGRGWWFKNHDYEKSTSLSMSIGDKTQCEADLDQDVGFVDEYQILKPNTKIVSTLC